MNYSHIELILAIADAGSISEAANKLFVSQAFLSATLKRIEDEIGTPLFKRSKTGVSLTTFGHEYIPYARHIADQIESLNGLYKARKAPPLQLNVVSMGFCFLFPMLAIIDEKYQGFPHVFQLDEGTAPQQINLVASGEYEVGLVVLSEVNKKQMIRTLTAKGLEYFRLREADTGIYVSKTSKSFPADVTVLNRETVKYLIGMPFISLYIHANDMFPHQSWREFTSLYQGQDRYFVASNCGMRTEMIKQYDGFSTASYCTSLYEKYPFTEDIRFVPFAPELKQQRELGWIQRSNQPRSVLANELYNLLQY